MLTTYDRNNQVLRTQTLAFVHGVNNLFVIFPKTSEIFPGSMVNTNEGKPFVHAQRTAVVSITFDTPFAYTVDQSSLISPHGQGLFFDPYLKVLNTGERIHKGDARLLSVPSGGWRWPKEQIRIDRAYPWVIFSPGSPTFFTFLPQWWTKYNHCVYDGVKCGSP